MVSPAKMQLPKPQTVFLYFSACIVNLMFFASTVAFTWTSSSIPRLNGSKEPANNPLSRPITVNEESWIGSLYVLGSTIGPFLAGVVQGRIGRKMTIVLFAIPLVICFLMKAFATNVETILAARFLGGVSAGTMYITIPIYLAEISESGNRGAIGTLLGVFATCGNLYSYAVGSYVSIKWFSLSGLVAPIILLVVLTFFIPESPYFHVLKGNESAAVKALKKFRANTDEEIAEEIENIKKVINESYSTKVKFLDVFKTRASRRSLLITAVGSAIQQLTGIFPIQLYLQTIFSHSDNSVLNPELSTIIVGAMKVVAFVITLFMIDRLGRRILLLQSCTGVFLVLISLGTFFFLEENGHNTENLSWFPLVFLLIFVVFYNSGMGSVMIVLIGELFPQRLKSAASILVITMSSVLSFLTTLAFPYMLNGFGLGITFWIFSVSGIVFFVFVYFMLPETKGKSLYEIQILLNEKY